MGQGREVGEGLGDGPSSWMARVIGPGNITVAVAAVSSHVQPSHLRGKAQATGTGLGKVTSYIVEAWGGPLKLHAHALAAQDTARL